MKAKVLATGKIIDADRLPCKPDLFYGDGHVYSEADLEFLPDTPEEVTIEGYVARDKNGYLVLHYKKPHRTLGGNKWYSGQSQRSLPKESFPEITWDSDPKRVKITLTPME